MALQFLGAGGILAKLNTAATIAFLLQAGGNVVNFFRNRGKGENTETEKINKENFNRSKNFGDVNRRLRGGGSGRSVTTRAGALSFLGDPSRRLDDAPDIVEENQSVLGGVETLGGAFPLPNTQTPDIENQKIIDSGFLGVRLEIDKINRNIDAIAAALAESAGFEEKYRKDMIAAMRRDLVEKGKDRSETRSERSIFNLITRPVKEVQTRFGNLAKGLQNALLLSVGLEAGAAMADLFDGDPTSGGDNKSDDKTLPPGSNNKNTPQVGDYYRAKNRKYYVLQSDGSFKKTSHVRPKEGRQFKREDFDPVVETLTKGENTNLNQDNSDGESDNIDGKEVSFLNFNTSSGENNNFSNSIFNSNESVAMNTGGLEGRDRFTFIDMTTNKGGENIDAQNGEAGTQFDDSILDGEPSRGPGYEVFLSGSVA